MNTFTSSKNWLKYHIKGLIINGSFSGREEVSRGLLQRLLVGPVLLNRLINDGNEAVNSMLMKSADDSKLWNVAKHQQGQRNNTDGLRGVTDPGIK